MLDFLFFALGAVSTFILAGGKEEYNAKITAMWDSVDGSFTTFVRGLKERRASEVANKIGSFFGFIAALMLVAAAVLMIVGSRPPLVISTAFVYSFIVWQGVTWYTRAEHWKHTKELASLSLMVLSMPLMDTLLGSNFTVLTAQPLDMISTPLLGISVTGLGNPWLIGVVSFGVFFTVSMFMIAMMHMIFLPVMFSAVAIALLSILSARFLHTVSSNRPLRPFMVVLAVISLAYFAFK